MRFRTKRELQKIMCVFCTMFILVGMVNGASMKAYAAEDRYEQEGKVDVLQAELIEYANQESKNVNTRTMLINCSIYTSFSEDGLHIEITTGTAGFASVIGIKDIVIKQRVWYGWKTIATGSGGEASDCSMVGVTINYPNVEVGETYRITCVHYGDVNGYDEVSNDTGGFVFQY